MPKDTIERSEAEEIDPKNGITKVHVAAKMKQRLFDMLPQVLESDDIALSNKASFILHLVVSPGLEVVKYLEVI